MKKHKKIIAFDARPLSMPHTGIAIYTKLLIKSLSRVYKVVLVSDAEIIGIEELKSQYKVGQVITKKHSRLYWEQLVLPRILKELQPHCYVATWNFGLPLFSKDYSKKILIVNDLIPLEFPKIYLRSMIEAFVYKTSLRVSLRKADSIVCISNATKDQLANYFPGRNPVVIPINLKKITSIKKSNNHGDYFVYVGGLDPRKKVENLVRAFNKLSEIRADLRLFIIGSNYGPIIDLVKSLGLVEKVVFTGYLSEGDKNVLIKSAKALVFPSISEGFGLPVAEAIILGTPVICGDTPALREVAGRAAVYINAESIESIRSALEVICSKGPAEAQKLAIPKQAKLLTDGNMQSSYLKLISSLI